MGTPWLERVSENFPRDGGPGNVRLGISNITAQQWGWLEPILRQILPSAPQAEVGDRAKRTKPPRNAKEQDLP